MFKRNITLYAMWVCALLVCLNSFGKVPEPDTIFYGTVQHLSSQPLIPSEGEDIEVQALGNDGELLATTQIVAGTNTYVLRIPMDDGEEARILGTAQGGDVIHIRVVNLDKKLSYEVNETEVAGIALGEERGIVLQQEFVLDQNLKVFSADNDAMADAWEVQYSVPSVTGVLPLSLTEDDASLDNDGDGFSNLKEYLAGTNPLDKDNYFKIMDVKQIGTIYQVKCGPVKAGKYYMINFKESLTVPDWTTLVRVEALSDSDYLSWAFNIEDSQSGVFQAQVEMR